MQVTIDGIKSDVGDEITDMKLKLSQDGDVKVGRKEGTKVDKMWTSCYGNMFAIYIDSQIH